MSGLYHEQLQTRNQHAQRDGGILCQESEAYLKRLDNTESISDSEQDRILSALTQAIEILRVISVGYYFQHYHKPDRVYPRTLCKSHWFSAKNAVL